MADPSNAFESLPPRPTLGQVALLFLRLGATAFGGPAAHIAMMEDEVVHRRRWLSRPQFLDLLGATNLIPGPNSTEMAIHIGLLAGGWGLVIAGVCFILPAFLIVTLLAWAYVTYQALPELSGLFYGVKPVLIAILAQALWKLGKDSLKSPTLVGVAAAVVGLTYWDIDELVLLFGAGLVLVLVLTWQRPTLEPKPHLSLGWGVGLFALTPAAAVPFSLGSLFWFFIKVGSILYGSGYVLLAFLRADLVERWGWLTETELLDAVAIGQVTPGPVFTTATFIGYLLGEKFQTGALTGALSATVGIFLPSFIFVALSGPLIPRLRESRIAGAFLDGVIAASLALMGVVTFHLADASLVDPFTWVLALAAAVLLVRFRVNSTWLVLAGALLGIGLTSGPSWPGWK